MADGTRKSKITKDQSKAIDIFQEKSWDRGQSSKPRAQERMKWQSLNEC